MAKKNKNKAPEAKPGGKPHASKHKIQQSAHLASAVSLPEKAKKPKAVAAEATPLSPTCLSVFANTYVNVYINVVLNILISVFNGDYVSCSLNIFVSVVNIVFNITV
jgi:hypothetical protein